jgi:hypothetical protein
MPVATFLSSAFVEFEIQRISFPGLDSFHQLLTKKISFLKYLAIISYRMCRSIAKIQHRDVNPRIRSKKEPAAEAGLDALRSWPGRSTVRHEVAILENKKLHLEGGVR